MNEEIEKRIVAMYFDNDDFEKNAKQTINTLGELKSNLNLENSVKGFDELDKAGKKLNLNQARTTISNMKESLEGMGGALKKAFDIGTAPLHALDNFFGTFRSYVGKFLGFDLASKFVSSLESAMRQLTTAPIEAGWSMYQANVDSTKTIMSGTLKTYKEQMSEANADWTYDEAEHMQFVKEQLAELSSYAQKTVFSLSDMTANVGKFTNNSIDLETSVTAMEGIANMTAKAGQGAQQASMAMYNFSQALGVGKMTTIDWKSIENANLATTELKDLFIQTAEAAGKLTKEVSTDANGKKLERFFLTVDKNGKNLAKNKWVEISAENFRDSLSNGWLDKETMLRVFKLYSNQVKDIDTLESWGFDTSNQELVEYLFGIGEEAEKAATQVRTFQKMWDAMTEAVQSGWADSMQYIFGDMLEATDFWTTINDKIGSVLDAAAEKRNNLLREWRGMSFNEETQEWEKVEGAVDGREDLVQGIYGTIDALKSLGSAFRKAWSDVFGEMTGKRLQEITKGFRDLVDRFKEWLGDVDDTESRLGKIRKGVSGLLSVVKAGWSILKGVLDLGLKIVKPVIDPLLNLFAKLGEKLDLSGAKNLGEMFTMLRDKFTGFFTKLKELGFSGIFSKIGEKLGGLWEDVKTAIGNFLDENGLTGVKDWFIGLGDKIQEGYETVKTWWESSGIPEFFTGIWNKVSGLFTPKDVYDDRGFKMNYKEDAPIVSFFKNMLEGVKGTWKDITEWEGWEAIGGFFTNVWDKVSGIFKPKLASGYRNGRLESWYEDAPIVSFFKNLISGVEDAWKNVKEWKGWKTIGKFFADIWNKVSGIFQPTQVLKWDRSGPNGAIRSWYEQEDTPIVAFFKGIYNGITKAWDDLFGENGQLTTWWNGGDNVVANFFKDIWDAVSGIFATTDAEGNQIEMPIVTFFKSIYNSITETWDDLFGENGQLTTWWNGGDNAVANFFKDLWNTVLGFFRGGEEVSEVAEEAETLSSEAEKAAPVTAESVSLLTRIVDAISGFVSRIAESLNGVVIPQEVATFFTNALDVLKSIIGFIGDMLGHFNNIISGKGSASEIAVVAIIGIIALLEQIFSYKNNKNLAKIQTESIASKFMAMGVGLLAISAAISLLTTIDQVKMWSAVGAVAVIGVVLGAIVGILAKLTKNKTGLAAVEGKTQIWEKLIGAVEKIGMIAVAMALLPNIIKAFGEAKKMTPELKGEDFLQLFLGLAALISTVSIALGLVSKLTGNVGISPVAALKTALAVVAFLGTISLGFLGAGGVLELIDGIADTISGKDVDSTEAIAGALEKVAAFAKGVGSIFNGFVRGLLGLQTDEEKQDQAIESLENLAGMSERFDMETTSSIMRILNMIGELSKVTKDLDTSKLDGFEKSMDQLARGVLRFSWIFLGIEENGMVTAGLTTETYRQYQDAIGIVRQILESFEPLSSFGMISFGRAVDQFSDFANDDNKVKRFVDGVKNILSSLGGLTDGSNVNFDGISIVRKMYEAIQTNLDDPKADLPEFNAMPIVDDLTNKILESLGYGSSAIALAVHELVQSGIDNSGKAGNSGGYTLNEGAISEFLGILNDPSSVLGQGEMNTDELTKWLYGEGGTAENPAADSPLGVLNGFNEQIDGFEFTDLGDKFQNMFSFKDPETGEDMDLTTKLTEALGEVQEKINETSFEIKIVPVIDMSHMDAEALRKTLGDYPIRMNMGSFSMPQSVQIEIANLAKNMDLEGVRSDIRSVTTAVDFHRTITVKALNELGGKINSLSNDIAKMKLYLDTGVLVGGITPMIDRELGKRSDNAESTGVSPYFGSNYSTDGVYALLD